MRDGSSHGALVEVHPDPRVQEFVEQVREQEIAQAIDRLRLVHREVPAEVFVLSNIVLPVTVDRLVNWRGLMPSRLDVAAARLDGVLPLVAGVAGGALPRPVEHGRGRPPRDQPGRVMGQTPIGVSSMGV